MIPVPIDDSPLDALEKQFQMEDLSVSPVTKAVLVVVSQMTLGWPFDKLTQSLKGRLAADSLERITPVQITIVEKLLSAAARHGDIV